MSKFIPGPGERLILPTDPCLQYSGRIDDENPDAPVFHYVCSFIRLRLTGGLLKLALTNIRNCWENRLGVIVDGEQTAVLLPESGDAVIDLSGYLHGGVNDVMIFKRQDSCHAFVFHGLIVAENAEVSAPPALPERRMEVYGDSVSAGEVSEAEDYCGKVDPEHNGQYSNGWLSYAWQTARLLNAQLHDIAQGGISLQDGTGYFNAPDYLGMLSCWDKAAYNPFLGERKPWDFARYTPHVAIIAIGQNDAHPVNFMQDDFDGEQARQWREDYRRLVSLIRGKYPKAHIVLSTTILGHAPQWDEAIDMVCRELQKTDSRVHHFLYEKNGCGTPGHIRGSEAAGMAKELAAYIDSLPGVWEDA
ncbi:MAG: electron transporter RnfD [Christensenellaceae bacterium]|nr:electron transporter RnfD [Christensenellaceae bacterium]